MCPEELASLQSGRLDHFSRNVTVHREFLASFGYIVIRDLNTHAFYLQLMLSRIPACFSRSLVQPCPQSYFFSVGIVAEPTLHEQVMHTWLLFVGTGFNN